MQTNVQIRELLTTYSLEEAVMNLRQHDRLFVRQRLNDSQFRAMLTSGEGGVSLLLDTRDAGLWHRVELLALARHAPRLMASALSTSNFGNLLRDPACRLAYVAQSTADSEVPRFLQKVARTQDLHGVHLKNGEPQIEDWGIPREDIYIPVFNTRVKAENTMCTIRHIGEALLGCIWQSRAKHAVKERTLVVDAFAEGEAPALVQARKLRVPEWTTLEIREVQRFHQWKKGDAEVEVWLERLVEG